MSMGDSQLVVAKCRECVNRLELLRGGVLGLMARRPGRLSVDLMGEAVPRGRQEGFRQVLFSPASAPANVHLLDGPCTWIMALSAMPQAAHVPRNARRICSDRVEEMVRAEMVGLVHELFFDAPLAADVIDATILVLALYSEGERQIAFSDWMIERLGQLVGGERPEVDAKPLQHCGGYSLVIARYMQCG